LGIPIFAKDGKNTILSLIFHALQIGVILWECTPPEELKKAGVSDDMVRLSIGIEHIDDLKEDLLQALASD